MIVDAILVPQGAEYQSVCRGLKSLPPISIPPVFPIPMGVKPVREYLEKWVQAGYLRESLEPKVLLMGLCGSLIPKYSVGDIVLYDSCTYLVSSRDFSPSSSGEDTIDIVTNKCDRTLNNTLSHQLKDKISLVKGFTSDRVISAASEKQHLANTYNTEVVDMEGFAALAVLNKANIAVSMIRVISDDSQHDLPNITSAISDNGSLKFLPLAIGMLQQPIRATRLITGAIRGLAKLEKAAKSLI